MLRFGPDIPIVHHLGLLAYFQHGQPTWFTSNASILVLTILSVLEILAQKNPEARKILQEFDIYLKPAVAALASIGFMSSEDAGFVNKTVHTAGYSEIVFPAISAILTWRLSLLRKRVASDVCCSMTIWIGTGLDKLISWLEDSRTVSSVYCSCSSSGADDADDRHRDGIDVRASQAA